MKKTVLTQEEVEIVISWFNVVISDGYPYDDDEMNLFLKLGGKI